MKRAALASVLALAVLAVPAAFAADPTTAATGEATTPAAEPFPAVTDPHMTKRAVVETFLAYPKVADWLRRYPPAPTTEATFDQATRRWTV